MEACFVTLTPLSQHPSSTMRQEIRLVLAGDAGAVSYTHLTLPTKA